MSFTQRDGEQQGVTEALRAIDEAVQSGAQAVCSDGFHKVPIR